MGRQLDIYVLSILRDKRTIGRFINLFVNRVASEDRQDEELMLLSLTNQGDLSSADAFEWQPAISLTNVLRIGLSRPPRAFTIYLTPKQSQIQEATLCFTTDNQIIFGLSIEDSGIGRSGVNRAQGMLKQLMTEFRGKVGMIVVEDAPPYNEDDFMVMAADSSTLLAVRSENSPLKANKPAPKPAPAPQKKRARWFRLGKARK